MVFVSVKDSSQYFIENKCSCLLWLFIPSKNNKQGHHAHSNAFGLRFAFCKTKTKKSSICMWNHEHQWEVKQIWRESRTSDRYSGFVTLLRAQRSPSSALNLFTYQGVSICFFFLNLEARSTNDGSPWTSIMRRPSLQSLKKGLLFWVPSRQRPKSAGHPAYQFCARKLASRKQRRL